MIAIGSIPVRRLSESKPLSYTRMFRYAGEQTEIISESSMALPLLPPPICNTTTRPSRRTSATAFHGDPPAADDPLLGFVPYIHQAPRRNSITPERQRAFIAILAASGIVTQAARGIGASLEALYNLRHRKGAEGFAEAWERALDRGMARLEDCALERAIQGEERVSFNRAGEVAARWTRYDTGLITFMLRQRRGDRFGGASGFAGLKPGHPVYERLRREWAVQAEEDSDAIIESINRKLDLMRERAIEAGEYRDVDDDNDDTSAPASAQASASADQRDTPADGSASQSRVAPRVINFD
ncbi:MAG: hypothetical protein ABIQ81_04090 [Novosphingobium sp.]